jgi:hypothetical protein
LKEELHGENFRSENEVISVLSAILIKIPIQMLSRAFEEWIETLHGRTANDRE